MTDAQPMTAEAIEWVLAPYFSGNRMPHMSGDPRNRLSPLQRRDVENASREIEALYSATIDALRADLFRAREERDSAVRVCGEWARKAGAAEQERDQYRNTAVGIQLERDQALARAEAAEAQRDRLKGVLKQIDDHIYIEDGTGNVVISGHFDALEAIRTALGED